MNKSNKFLVYRHGSNLANQHMCNKMPVAIVEAGDHGEACEKALEEENVSCYANQYLTAVPENKADPDDWNQVCEEQASQLANEEFPSSY